MSKNLEALVYLVTLLFGIYLSISIFKMFEDKINNNTINQLEKEKFEYCEVIAKLEWYAPDSVKYKYKHIIEFAKLQEFGNAKTN